MPVDPTAWKLTRRVATSHGEIAWDVLGEGPPVVLVHGTPSRSLLWRAVAPALAERFAVYVFDLLGFGDSERHEEQEVSIRVHAAVLAELVRVWDFAPPALVGHDIGGAAVLRAHLLEGIAARRIALIDAVVLAPWITPTTRHLQAHLDVYRSMPTHIFRELAAAHLRTATFAPMAPEVFAAYFDQWEGEHGHRLWLRNVRGFDEQDTADFESLLPSTTTRTRVIWGEEDAWLSPGISGQIESRLPNADRVLIPAAGHFSPEDQPAEVAQALADFLT
ncbi:MAG: alpha/beta hydrolase [Gaiellaceae bacterium MAG52_C11]|nr:alpha/beta hydrolase [Candidatus Gaiellasilicea maunaloa]